MNYQAEAWLGRAVSLCVFALIGIAAFLQARALSLLIASSRLLSPLGPRERARAGEPELSPGRNAGMQSSKSPGLERESLLPDEVVAPVDWTDPLRAPSCEGLTAFIVTESADRLWSVATLGVAGEPRAQMRRVGDHVSGKQVEFIGFNARAGSPAVWLSSSRGGLCQALLQYPPSHAPTTAAKAMARKASESTLTREVAAKIARISETEFNIERGAIQQILENQSELLRFVRVAPELEDGRAVGLRLVELGRKSVLSSLGLRAGDRIDSINGFNIATPEKALEAFAVLRVASNLDVRLQRGNATLNVAYRVR